MPALHSELHLPESCNIHDIEIRKIDRVQHCAASDEDRVALQSLKFASQNSAGTVLELLGAESPSTPC